MKLTAELVESALKSQQVWDLGNDVLYKLCSDYPSHVDTSAIIAKIWLIGRAYAAAVERRKLTTEFLGDDFYIEKVGPEFAQAGIDGWFANLARVSERDRLPSLVVHQKLTNLLYKITGLSKRSLASKYLHFHFPNLFYIYDSRADKSVRVLTRGIELSRHPPSQDDVDAVYADFVARCECLVGEIHKLVGRVLDPRELDKVLLDFSNKVLSPDAKRNFQRH